MNHSGTNEATEDASWVPLKVSDCSPSVRAPGAVTHLELVHALLCELENYLKKFSLSAAKRSEYLLIT